MEAGTDATSPQTSDVAATIAATSPGTRRRRWDRQQLGASARGLREHIDDVVESRGGRGRGSRLGGTARCVRQWQNVTWAGRCSTRSWSSL